MCYYKRKSEGKIGNLRKTDKPEQGSGKFCINKEMFREIQKTISVYNSNLFGKLCFF